MAVSAQDPVSAPASEALREETRLDYSDMTLPDYDPAGTPWLDAALAGAIEVPQDAGAAYTKNLSSWLGNAIAGAAQSGQAEGGDSA